MGVGDRPGTICVQRSASFTLIYRMVIDYSEGGSYTALHSILWPARLAWAGMGWHGWRGPRKPRRARINGPRRASRAAL